MSKAISLFQTSMTVVRPVWAFAVLALVLVGFSACGSSKNLQKHRSSRLRAFVDTCVVFQQNHVGIYVKNLQTERVLFEKNAEKRFTPASNLKILTLYAALNILPDTLPAFRFAFDADSNLLIRPLAYPTLLHPDFESWQSPFAFLKNQNKPILLDSSHWLADRYGLGWQWDDFAYAYAAERSALPLAGNVIRAADGQAGWTIFPAYFSKYAKNQGEQGRAKREDFSSILLFPKQSKTQNDTLFFPVFEAQKEFGNLLSSLLEVPVEISDLSKKDGLQFQTKYGAPRDTVLRKMMWYSDNFLAEQLLLQCAAVRQNDSISDLTWTKDMLFENALQNARWVDGSGMSRYNLISPKALTVFLEKTWNEQGEIQTLYYFPQLGKEGTVKGFSLKNGDFPLVFAKSGSLSGVYCLSGFLKNERGEWLAFAIMVNGFVGSSRTVKEAIIGFLQTLN